MKISFLIPSLRAGGAERQFLILSEELAKRGHSVNFITYKPEKNFYCCNNVKITHISKRQKIDLLFLKSLVAYVKQNNIDILFSCFEGRGIFEPPLIWARLVGLLYPKVRIIAGYRNTHLSKSQIIIERLTKNLVSLIIANNRYVLGLLRKKAKIDSDRLICIQNIAETEGFSPLPKDETDRLRLSYLEENNEKFVCGIIGSYIPSKNHVLLIEAIGLLKEEGVLNDFFFLAYGDETCTNSQFSNLTNMIERNCLKKKISLNPPEENINQLMNCLDALVVPSLYEGAPNVVMEALLCQKPVIISESANRAGFVIDGYNGLVFERNDHRQLAECLLRMKRNPIRVRESFLRRFRLEHDKEKVVDKYIGCFEIAAGKEIQGGFASPE